jgi:hypothetical protein
LTVTVTRLSSIDSTTTPPDSARMLPTGTALTWTAAELASTRSARGSSCLGMGREAHRTLRHAPRSAS